MSQLFQNLKSKYGKGRERKTEIRIFDEIVATKVVLRNEKLYVNREEGFVGTSLKKDEYVGECSDIDDVIVFMEDGKNDDHQSGIAQRLWVKTSFMRPFLKKMTTVRCTTSFTGMVKTGPRI
ncbi:MAG: hypothetical protein U5K51_14310 [Flavobacteriaceae bacterium]|nr:hypothetical protein [Flavobacteriaceae bacterium]